MTAPAAPIRFAVAPLRTFLEVPVADDPIYASIELQLLERGSVAGFVVLLTRRDGVIDLYADPGLGLDDRWFRTDGSTSNGRRGVVEQRSLAGTRLRLEPSSIAATVRFDDAEGRAIEVDVEAERARTRPNGLNVIPAIRRPVEIHQLPFLHAPEFWLLTRGGSTIVVSIDGSARTPTPFPVPIGLRRRYYARFATDLSLVSLNPRSAADVGWSPAPGGGDAVIDEATAYHVIDEATGPAVVSARSRGARTELVVGFDPPLPAGPLPTGGADRSGRLRFWFGTEIVGRGTYRLDRDGLTLDDLVQHWRPPWHQPSLGALALTRRLTRRGRRYRWSRSPTTVGAEAGWDEGPARS